ncbi:hypothetical protein FE257_005829 [Aspergillus nanangensis]|uniref:DUF7136 domain-containing protein n=1 Tax=Aspergillus nanangensis TaxID=2582783 RepID=A0AAD4CPS6_ASPNN|nr:hypothetical protein FE257_005829 [Aspergillus nanangensis]
MGTPSATITPDAKMGFSRNLLVFTLLSGLALGDSQTAEVDLLFPRRDEIFAPAPIVPIVFAIQNPRLLATLNPTLSYGIEGVSNPNGRNTTGGLYHLNEEKDFTNSSDPYLLKLMTPLLDIEGNFTFVWHLSLVKCASDSGTDGIAYEPMSLRAPFQFSLRHNASAPDMVIADYTDKKLCNRSKALAVSVSETQDLPSTKASEWRVPSCAVDPEWTTPSPCNVQIDASKAANISADLTAAACRWPTFTDPICPTPSPSSKGAAKMPQSLMTKAGVLAVGTLLAYSLAWH